MSSETAIAFEFGPFRLFPSEQLLLEGGKACPLGSRAIEILACLLERPGEMVTKRELLERVWPGTFVHEANLRVNVSALRKAIGDGQAGRRYIVNLTGQGYCFVAPVRHLETRAPVPQPPSERGARHNLPVSASRPLGRGSDIDAISVQLPMRRCVTIAGPGGIGKTTVAVAVAERLLPVYDDGVRFVDLSAIADEQLILQTVAQILGISLQGASPLASLIAYLADKRLLLLFDNCEHVIEQAAKLAEAILLGARQVSVLATSRETLRTNGEWVHWLAPMGVPSDDTVLTATEAMSFTAIRFFVDCAALSLEGFSLNDAEVPLAVAICRGLDGLPLAIELVAARIDLFGLKGLASVLEDPFLLLSEGRRGAFPRQQSLLRMLEWSYRLLLPLEQTILQRLSVFRGAFTLNGAVAIAGGSGLEPAQVYSAVLTLSAKSLLSSDAFGTAPHQQHRMLHVTRTLLSQKLAQTDEGATILRRHADFLCELLAQAESDWEVMTRPAWIERYAGSMADVRAAIDWAFSPQGDASLGVVLTARALPLGFQLSLIEEFRGRVERALLHSQRIRPPQPVSEIRLSVALGIFAHNTKGPPGARTAALERALELGRQMQAPAYQLEALIGLAWAHMNVGEYRAATDVATQARTMGQEAGLPMAALAAERILAQALHFDGEHAAASLVARQVIDHPAVRLPLALNLTPVDRRVSMQIVLARISWIQGRFEVADRLIRETLLFAKQDGAFSVCPTLAYGAIPIAIWNGDDGEARALNMLLVEEARRYTLGYWLCLAESFDAALRLRAGEPGQAPLMTDSLALETFVTFSPAWLTPEAASREKQGASGWCGPEMRRAQGEWLLAQRAPDAAIEAAGLFHEALQMARRQGAWSWELRAATSLARLWKSDERAHAAHDLLAEVLSRCECRRGTADLTAATTLLEMLSRDPAFGNGVHHHPVRRRALRRAKASRR